FKPDDSSGALHYRALLASPFPLSLLPGKIARYEIILLKSGYYQESALSVLLPIPLIIQILKTLSNVFFRFVVLA
ncbi:hypothetical protein, partial [Herbiconiux daphne]